MPLKFLVADDDARCRELLVDILQQYGKCVAANDGSSAVGAYRQALERQDPFDAVLLDVMMPDMDGQQALKSIRMLEFDHDLRGADRSVVIMVSALGDMNQLVTSVDHGCHSYVTKPIDEQQLLVELSDALGKKLQPVTETTPPSVASDFDHEKSDSDRLRYLIVDDDLRCRELLKDILSPHGSCCIAEHGREAVDVFANALRDGVTYDAVLLDIMMPNMGGLETLERLRQIENTHGIYCLSGTKVLMTTALDDSANIFHAFRKGCEAYIMKPVYEENLLEKLRELSALPDALPVRS